MYVLSSTSCSFVPYQWCRYTLSCRIFLIHSQAPESVCGKRVARVGISRAWGTLIRGTGSGT
jgi:hypothetical protein